MTPRATRQVLVDQRVARGPAGRSAGAGRRGRRQPGRLQRLAHQWRRAVERLRRPEGQKQYRSREHRGVPGTCRALRDRPGLHGGVLRVRARRRLLADAALRAPGRTHPGLLTGHMAGRGPARGAASRASQPQGTFCLGKPGPAHTGGPRCGARTPSAGRAPRCSTSGPRPNTRGNASGHPAAWTPTAGQATCRRPSTSPSMACATPTARSAPPPSCAASFPAPTSTATTS